MKIKRGSIYRDGWGRRWQTVCFDDTSGKWLMRLWDTNHTDYFSIEAINNNFMILYP